MSTVRVGDHGQQYMVVADGYPNPGENPIGYTTHFKGARQMALAILQAPRCKSATVVDRWETDTSLPANHRLTYWPRKY